MYRRGYTNPSGEGSVGRAKRAEHMFSRIEGVASYTFRGGSIKWIPLQASSCMSSDGFPDTWAYSDLIGTCSVAFHSTPQKSQLGFVALRARHPQFANVKLTFFMLSSEPHRSLTAYAAASDNLRGGSIKWIPCRLFVHAARKGQTDRLTDRQLDR